MDNVAKIETLLISVIIPVYNTEKYLRACLDSIVNQTHSNLQIILIDDGSKDNSGAICDEYAKKDSRIICVHQQNGGVSKARNEGLKLATGDYIHFPDSDDYIDLDTYEYLVKIATERRCDVVNFEHFITYKDREIAHSFSNERYGEFSVEGAHKQFMTGVQFCCNKLFSSKLIKGFDNYSPLYFREDILRGEDTLLSAYAIDRANKVWFDKRPLYHYVQSEESACRGKFRKSQLSIVKLFDAYEPLYKQKYPSVWNDFIQYMIDNLIVIYYDMWADEVDYKLERKEFKKLIKEKYKLIKKVKLGVKRRVKYNLFISFPTLFCLMHKVK